MPRNYFLCLLLSAVFLSGCHGAVGNVIPASGPSMEDVYDSMGTHKTKNNLVVETKKNDESDLESVRETKKLNNQSSEIKNTSALNHFHKLPNPDLRLYIYPHFAGTDEIPIPGYYTEFSAYEKTHYALMSEVAH